MDSFNCMKHIRLSSGGKHSTSHQYSLSTGLIGWQPEVAMVIYNDWYVVGVKADEFYTKILFIWFFFWCQQQHLTNILKFEKANFLSGDKKKSDSSLLRLHIAETHNVRNGRTAWSFQQEVEGFNRKWACLVKKKQLTSNMHELLSFTEQTVPSQLHT